MFLKLLLKYNTEQFNTPIFSAHILCTSKRFSDPILLSARENPRWGDVIESIITHTFTEIPANISVIYVYVFEWTK